MPLPEPKFMTITEAADYVARRCRVKRDKAETALERAFRDRALSLFDDRHIPLFDSGYEGMKFDWRTGIVETRVPINLSRLRRPHPRYLRVARRQLDKWIGPLIPACRAVERESETPSNTEIARNSPDSRARVPQKEIFAAALEIANSLEFQQGDGARSVRLKSLLEKRFPNMKPTTLERYSRGALSAASHNVVRQSTNRKPR